MKWFKHQSDSYSNLKHQHVLSEHGLEGYGLFWICVEMVAQQGVDYRIEKAKNWKRVLCYITRQKEEKIDEFLKTFAETKLIDQDSLDQGDLYIPKMEDNLDDYTNRVRRVSEPATDNVHLEQKRTDKNRIEKNRVEMFEQFWNAYPNKKTKKKAYDSWKKIDPSDKLFKEIMVGLERAKGSKQWQKDDGQYIPHPTTWLNQERWNDEDVLSPLKAKPKSKYAHLA